MKAGANMDKEEMLKKQEQIFINFLRNMMKEEEQIF